MRGEDSKEDKMFDWELICWLRSNDSYLNSTVLLAEVSLHPGINCFAAQVKCAPSVDELQGFGAQRMPEEATPLLTSSVISWRILAVVVVTSRPQLILLPVVKNRN